VHKSGQVSIVETRGNEDCHVILRGGKAPNYDAASVEAACAELAKSKLECRLMIDFSHANSEKKYKRQLDVARDVGAQVAGGSRCIIGAMVESHLVEGKQELAPASRSTVRPEHHRSLHRLGRFGRAARHARRGGEGAPQEGKR
jgi:3-deoxy-7-phosphoheptulonate synthase